MTIDTFTFGAGDEARTRDLQLGRLSLYQLSYSRITAKCCLKLWVGKDGFEPPNSEEDRFTVCCRWPLGYLPPGDDRIVLPEPKTGIEPATY